MNIIIRKSLTLALFFIFISPISAHANSICDQVAANSAYIFSNLHIIKNNPNKDELLNSTERKKKLFKTFTDKIDPYKIFITKEVYDSFENSIIQYTPESSEFCNLLNQYYNAGAKSKNEVIKKFFTGTDQQILDSVKNALVQDEKLRLNKTKKISENRVTNKEESLWGLTEILAGLYETTQPYEDNDTNNLIGGLRIINNLFKVSNDDLFSIFTNSYLYSVDIHTSYYDKEASKVFFRSSEASFRGVGIGIGYAHNGIRILKIFKDGPADKTGLIKAGDIITAVNGNTEITLGTTQEFSNYITSQTGDLTLSIERKGKAIGDIKITPGNVDTTAETVTSETHKKNNTLAYINFDSFFLKSASQEGSAESIKAELEKDEIKNSDGLIIDLRNNGGGSLNDALSIVGFFIGENTIGEQVDYNLKSESLVAESSLLYKKPIIVIVNEYSASASEILAGSIKQFNRGVVIGSKQTFGKGLVQSLQRVTGEGYLKSTIASYHLANGKSPQFDGIHSDIMLHPEKPEDQIFSERSENPFIKDLPLGQNILAANPERKWMTDEAKAKLIGKLQIPLVNAEKSQDIEKEQALQLLDQLIEATLEVKRAKAN